MKKSYVEYIVEETQKLLAIDSPSGYTANVAEYLMKEYRKLGYEGVAVRKDYYSQPVEDACIMQCQKENYQWFSHSR